MLVSIPAGSLQKIAGGFRRKTPAPRATFVATHFPVGVGFHTGMSVATLAQAICCVSDESSSMSSDTGVHWVNEPVSSRSKLSYIGAGSLYRYSTSALVAHANDAGVQAG